MRQKKTGTYFEVMPNRNIIQYITERGRGANIKKNPKRKNLFTILRTIPNAKGWFTPSPSSSSSSVSSSANSLAASNKEFGKYIKQTMKKHKEFAEKEKKKLQRVPKKVFFKVEKKQQYYNVPVVSKKGIPLTQLPIEYRHTILKNLAVHAKKNGNSSSENLVEGNVLSSGGSGSNRKEQHTGAHFVEGFKSKYDRDNRKRLKGHKRVKIDRFVSKEGVKLVPLHKLKRIASKKKIVFRSSAPGNYYTLPKTQTFSSRKPTNPLRSVINQMEYIKGLRQRNANMKAFGVHKNQMTAAEKSTLANKMLQTILESVKTRKKVYTHPSLYTASAFELSAKRPYNNPPIPNRALPKRKNEKTSPTSSPPKPKRVAAWPPIKKYSEWATGRSAHRTGHAGLIRLLEESSSGSNSNKSISSFKTANRSPSSRSSSSSSSSSGKSSSSSPNVVVAKEKKPVYKMSKQELLNYARNKGIVVSTKNTVANLKKKLK